MPVPTTISNRIHSSKIHVAQNAISSDVAKPYPQGLLVISPRNVARTADSVQDGEAVCFTLSE